VAQVNWRSLYMYVCMLRGCVIFVIPHMLHISGASAPQGRVPVYYSYYCSGSLLLILPRTHQVRETNHYAVDSVIVKNKSHLFREANPRGSHSYMSTFLNPHTNTSPAHTEGPSSLSCLLSQYVCACACVCVSARAKSELFGTDHNPCLQFPSNTSSIIPDELPV
jgi:hypothetical protein